ncbi:MAG: diguanylate cyclase [Thermodesulfobacteriota bacterium]|nr:diguanylate cyclase [Thermodesulfobacteriota bacterium]
MDSQLTEVYEKETGAPFLDNLTELYNHGFFQISLDREVKRSERHGGVFTLALIDLDSFASYNKRYGSVQGDCVLREIAGLVVKNIRQVDLAARYSGNVIALILLRSDIQSALIAVERIRKAIEKMFSGDPTVSVGLASYPTDATQKSSLITNAHEALLQAKINGKNKIYFYEKEKGLMANVIPRILVVDDEPKNVKLLEALLHISNYEVIKAYNGEDALSVLSKVDIDLVLLDVMMPDMDGFEVCRRLKGSEDTRLVPVVMVTALSDIEARIKGIEAGADDFITKPPNKVELLARVKSLINMKALNNNLTSIENVLFSLANAVEANDVYTQGHIKRVANLAVDVGGKMGLSGKEIEALKIGGILHDIGKIGVSGDILNKPEALNAEEWEVMKRHADDGYKICLPLKKNLGEALEVIRYHHEKLDGSGYPDGLKGEEIPRVARIMAVVDIYDALVTDRPYRPGIAKEEAFAIIEQEAREGKLDNEVVTCLKDMVQ